MKTTRILISLLIICLLFTSFGGQVVEAAVHPSLYFTQQELDNLKALRTAPSHQAIWNNIEYRVNSNLQLLLQRVTVCEVVQTSPTTTQQ